MALSMYFLRSFALAFVMIWPLNLVQAQTQHISLSDLLASTEDIDELILLDPQVEQNISKGLEALGAELTPRGLTLSRSEQDLVLDSGCENATLLEQLDVEITLLNDSALTLDIQSLSRRNAISIVLDFELEAWGRLQQKVGERLFGRCYVLGKDSFDVSVSGAGQLGLSVEVDLNLTSQDGLWFAKPEVSVKPWLDAQDYAVDIDGSFLAERAKDQIADALNASLDSRLFADSASELESQLLAEIKTLLGGSGVLLEEGPGVTLPQEAVRLLEADLLGSIGAQYIEANYPMIARAVIDGDSKSVVDLAVQAASCELAARERVNLPSTGVYLREGEACLSVDPGEINEAQPLYSDSACERTFDHRPMSWIDYCSETLDSMRLGNGLLNSSFDGAWQQSPGTALNISVEPIDGNAMPWMTRRTYKTINEEGKDSCGLEMRIYKKSVDASGQKSLLALHGGAWDSRVLGFIGLESMVSHFTEQGYVVYLPFYRLTGNKEATDACNGVTGKEILVDVQEALDWVQGNHNEFGSGEDVYLFGQSAGAHLSLALAYRNPERIRKAALMYPPTDFGELLTQYQLGELSEETATGVKAVEAFLGKPLVTSSVSDADIVENSFPALIGPDAEGMPPVFIIHGVKDRVVPVDQAIRLCKSYGGEKETYLPIPDLRAEFSCGSGGSRMHLFAEGDHALDACLFSLYCPAGSLESQRQVADSMRQIRAWFDQDEVGRGAQLAAVTEAGGGGVGAFLIFIAGLTVVRRRLLLQAP